MEPSHRSLTITINVSRYNTSYPLVHLSNCINRYGHLRKSSHRRGSCPGGEGTGVQLAIGSKQEASKVMMVPFGARRRTCPGMGYAMLHLEYFLTNLVTAFEWRRIPGEEVDLTADYGFIITMQHPLRALVVPQTTMAASW
ncbi:hypothetical protein E2562_010669 [Oryza meyeriana var. granulata]|uniref:Cytochrome P450 n=1 Tax=Oryza meyeriana var. granulata TaxID=110450 RepID=A0A6G1EW05_9ORYZ|nr:hypothetical protein E2562_010669 [Oryza meyeriana var. granulata]